MHRITCKCACLAVMKFRRASEKMPAVVEIDTWWILRCAVVEIRERCCFAIGCSFALEAMEMQSAFLSVLCAVMCRHLFRFVWFILWMFPVVLIFLWLHVVLRTMNGAMCCVFFFPSNVPITMCSSFPCTQCVVHFHFIFYFHPLARLDDRPLSE